MLLNIKALRRGDLDSVDPRMLYPILRWLSGSEIELPWCSVVNKNFFWVPPEIIKGYIWSGLRDPSTFIKYPKAQKIVDNKVYNLKKDLLKQFYGWSEQEFTRNSSNIDRVSWNVISDSLGVDNKTRKLLGLEPLSKKPIKVQKKAKNLFDFT